jgi:hypothetical protein
MRYWWVNQNQTYRHEVQGGYLWSPKRNANGARNPFYESMREVAPGDLIFSFMDTRILALGIAQSYCWESPKPLEFGNAGQNWENVGWKVKVIFTELANKVRPKDHIEILRPLLPVRYSPLQPNGNGLQSVYLTEVPTPLAEVLTIRCAAHTQSQMDRRLHLCYVAAVIHLYLPPGHRSAQLVTDALVMAIWRQGKPDAFLPFAWCRCCASAESFFVSTARQGFTSAAPARRSLIARAESPAAGRRQPPGCRPGSR